MASPEPIAHLWTLFHYPFVRILSQTETSFSHNAETWLNSNCSVRQKSFCIAIASIHPLLCTDKALEILLPNMLSERILHLFVPFLPQALAYHTALGHAFSFVAFSFLSLAPSSLCSENKGFWYTRASFPIPYAGIRALTPCCDSILSGSVSVPQPIAGWDGYAACDFFRTMIRPFHHIFFSTGRYLFGLFCIVFATPATVFPFAISLNTRWRKNARCLIVFMWGFLLSLICCFLCSYNSIRFLESLLFLPP